METNERVLAMVRIDRQDVTVRILSVFKTGDGRKVASVEALPVNGRQIKPFTQYSIGGPSQSSQANIRLEYLRGISRVTEQEPAPAPKPEPKKPVLGTIRINGRDVEVEVYEVYTTVHGERVAGIRTREVDGKRPKLFINYSNGRYNPYTDSARIPVSEIKGLAMVEEGA